LGAGAELAWVPGLSWLQSYVAPGSLIYLLAYVVLIFFFTYFYSSLVFDPHDLAKNLREAGGFVPGVRPGDSTARYLTDITGRLLLVGATFLAGIAVLPFIFRAVSGSPWGGPPCSSWWGWGSTPSCRSRRTL